MNYYRKNSKLKIRWLCTYIILCFAPVIWNTTFHRGGGGAIRSSKNRLSRIVSSLRSYEACAFPITLSFNYANLLAILAPTKSYKLAKTNYEAIFAAFLWHKFDLHFDARKWKEWHFRASISWPIKLEQIKTIWSCPVKIGRLKSLKYYTAPQASFFNKMSALSV